MAKCKAFVLIPHSKDKGTTVEIEALPLILCEDCIHWKSDGSDTTRWLPCQEVRTEKNWFCASGEAKQTHNTNMNAE